MLTCLICIDTFIVGFSSLTAFSLGIKYYWKFIIGYLKKIVNNDAKIS